MKPLEPTLKEKKRYVAFEVISKKSIGFEAVKSLILKTLKEFFGTFGLAKIGITFLEFENKKGVIRVDNKFVDNLKASFVLMKEENIMIRSVGVSGTLKKIRTKYLGV